MFNVVGGAEILADTRSETRWGWMVGTGLEYAFAGNWSAKVEYNYMVFGSERVIFTIPAGSFPIDIDQHIHLVKFGINYRFGGPAAVIARY